MLNQLLRKKDLTAMIQEAGSASSGLIRSLTATQLVLLGIGAIVGTGIFVITGQAAATYAGPALTISFVISALCCIMAALCYAEFAAMIPVAGSVYSYSYATMGEGLAWFIGWTLILEYLFACSSVAVGWSGYMVNLLEGWGLHIPPQISMATFDIVNGQWIWTGSLINFPAVFVIAIISVFLIGGIQQSALVNNIFVAIKVGVILLFIAFGLSYVDVGNWQPYIPQNTGEYGHFGWSGILRGAGVAFYAYLGFDALSTAAQETRNPQKDMPKGILGSLFICAALYVAVTAVLTGMVSYTELNVPAPIALAIDKAGQGLAWLSPFLKLGAIAGITSVILVMMLGQSRIYYAISKDGLLPKSFAKVNLKHGTPQNATIFACIVTAIVAGLFPLNVLAEMVSIGTLLAFAVVCIAIVVLRKTAPDIKRPFKTPFVPFLPLLGAALCILQMTALPFGTWMRLIIWSVAGVVVYFVFGMKNSKLNKV